MGLSRFAPSTTGEAHPGTFLSALLVWLDARASGLRCEIRFEDLDRERCRAEHLTRMREDIAWLGLRFDQERVQSEHLPHYAEALDRLESLGVLYPCSVSRKELRALGVRAPDGSSTYDNRNRHRSLPSGGWRASEEPVRVRLPDRVMRLEDESGVVVEHALREFGDPVVRRRDGCIAYQLASVVDDAASGVTRIVRGRDLLAGTLVQMALQDLLELSRPSYRHHLLLLEGRQEKLSKLHGAVGASELRAAMEPEELLGTLAYAAGLVETPAPTSLEALDFDWTRVRSADRLVQVETSGRLSVE